MSGKRRLHWLLVVASAGALMLFPVGALADDDDPNATGVEAPAAALVVDAAVTVDPATAPQLESPALPSDAFINRPDIALDEYVAAKQDAARAPRGPRAQPSAPLSTTLGGGGGNGQNQGAPGPGLFPPDTSGAVSGFQVVQTLNSKLAVYTKANPPALVCANSFATLTGYNTTTLFDPRVVYDPLWNRWVVSVEAFPLSGTDQRQLLLISRTSNACGSWIVYNFDVNYTNIATFFWDFPNLGMTQDAIILTANVFGSNPNGGHAIAIAKALLYNGFGFSVPIFNNLGSTVTPPIVLDQNPHAKMLQRNINLASVALRTFFNPANGFFAAMSGPTNVAVSSVITVPANAAQPGCTAGSTCALDTGDARFSSQTWQYSDNLWATHTISSGGLPTPKWYDIDIAGAGINTVKQQGFYFATATSSDFNASIAARTNGRAYVSWNASGSTFFVQQRASGRTAADALNTLGSQIAVATSAVSLTGNFDPNFGSQRWGDYSNTWPDSSTTTCAWGIGERVNTSTTWGTRLQRFCNN
jgi:hypothetical protein